MDSKHFDTSDKTNRHNCDVELRGIGFRIHSRPSRGEPIWERHGVLCKQSEAEKILGRDKEK